MPYVSSYHCIHRSWCCLRLNSCGCTSNGKLCRKWGDFEWIMFAYNVSHSFRDWLRVVLKRWRGFIDFSSLKRAVSSAAWFGLCAKVCMFLVLCGRAVMVFAVRSLCYVKSCLFGLLPNLYHITVLPLSQKEKGFCTCWMATVFRQSLPSPTRNLILWMAAVFVAWVATIKAGKRQNERKGVRAVPLDGSDWYLSKRIYLQPAVYTTTQLWALYRLHEGPAGHSCWETRSCDWRCC